jgi:hypothetical protein
MGKKTRSRKRLVPRDLPARGGFSIPANEIRDNAAALYSELNVAARELSVAIAEDPRLGDLPVVSLPASLFNVQLYSRAVQVFTAMAVEVSLNTYGLIRFGAEQFASVERYGLPKKLLTLLDHDKAGRPAETDPIVVATKRLAERRNALVHQQSDETILDPDGQIKFVGDPINPPVTYEAAQAAMIDMEVFFQEFGRRDRELSWLFQS